MNECNIYICYLHLHFYSQVCSGDATLIFDILRDNFLN